MQSLPEQISRYRVLGLIGKGGMGIVVKGYDEMLQRTVAIKILSPHLAQDETTVARFLSEARAAASLQHPNIITIYEAGEDKGLYYFVMEFVNGKDLATVLRERGSLSVEETLVIAEQIASALDYAHQRGIIHRDIKASNIMVTVDGLVKVTDFGIARVLGGERFTQTGVLVGTPEYMAPELWEGKEASKASDIYAFGVLVYEMLTGEVPFSGTTPMAVGYKHVHEPVPIERLRGKVREGVIDALEVALAKSPEKRFQSALAFVRAIREQQTISLLTVTPTVTPLSSAAPTSSDVIPGAVSPLSPVKVTVQRSNWLIWFAGLLVVLGTVVVIGGSFISRHLEEYHEKKTIYPKENKGTEMPFSKPDTELIPSKAKLRMKVCEESNLLARADCPRVIWKEFEEGKEPDQECILQHRESVKVKDEEIIKSIIEQWKQAWQNGNLEEYMNFYSINFYSRYMKMNYNQWRDYKKKIFSRYYKMEITIQSMTITIQDDEAVVKFYQVFKGYGVRIYMDRGWKTIKLIKEDGQWKIVQEEWKEDK